jgi:hypothetical protein
MIGVVVSVAPVRFYTVVVLEGQGSEGLHGCV